VTGAGESLVAADDGACAHLVGRRIPPLVLPSTRGPVALGDLASRTLVLYAYPRTGIPGEDPPPGWDAIPGARGCTPQSCAFRDLHADLAAQGARVAGLSTQNLVEQQEFALRNEIAFPLISDPALELAHALALPTFVYGQRALYARATIVADTGRVVRVFYPVFPPEENAGEVLTWLQARSEREAAGGQGSGAVA
jgi:peroxiredoxin